jgi:hypothetical protein
MRRRAGIVVSTMALVLSGAAGFGWSSVSAHTAPHVHGITAGNGEVHEVAIGLCNTPWDIAGDSFHHNVHVGGPDGSSGAPAISITSVGACP